MQNETQLDDDMGKAATPIAVQAAAVCVGITGLFFMTLGLQNLIFIKWIGSYRVVPFLFLGMGLFSIVLACFMGKVRVWAAVTALVLMAPASFAMLFWIALSFLSGVISPLALLDAGLSLLSALLVLITIGRFIETSAARRRLKKEGLEIGI